MTAIIEVTLSWLFKNAKGRDEKSFFNGPAFADSKEQTIAITSPDCGPTDATLAVEYTADGSGRIPTLEWTAPPDIAPKVKEWLMVSEDPDVPLPAPIAHGFVILYVEVLGLITDNMQRIRRNPGEKNEPPARGPRGCGREQGAAEGRLPLRHEQEEGGLHPAAAAAEPRRPSV